MCPNVLCCSYILFLQLLVLIVVNTVRQDRFGSVNIVEAPFQGRRGLSPEVTYHVLLLLCGQIVQLVREV